MNQKGGLIGSFFFILFILILLAAAALAVFVFTFNANRYKPLITEKLEKALGRPVELDKITLGWHEGLALDLKGLTLLNPGAVRSEFLRLDSAAVRVNPKALLEHRLEVTSVILDSPEITMTGGAAQKAPESTIQPSGQTGAAPQASSAKPAPAVFAFLIDVVKIKNGRFHFIDKKPGAPVDLSVDKMDVTVKDISPAKAVTIDARSALFSKRQNLSADGKVRIVPEESGAVLQDFTANMDLSSVDAEKLMKAVPALQETGLAKEISGQLEAKINRLKFAWGKMQEFDADLHLDQGSFKTGAMPLPLQNVNADLNAARSRIVLRHLSASAGNGRIAVTGASDNYRFPDAQTQFEGSLEGFQLAEFAPAAGENAPRMEGVFSASFRAAATGNAASLIMPSLNGEGQAELNNGVLRNLNVIREIVKKLSTVPAVSASLQKHLPQGYEQKLNERDTVFAPIKIPFAIRQGNLVFDRAVIESESFYLNGSGSLNLATRAVQIEAMLTVERDFSQALIAGVNELRYLANSQGELQIPVTVQGFLPKPSVVPNLQWVISRLAAGKAQEALSGMLYKNQNAAGGTAGTAAGTTGQGTAAPTGPTDYRKMKGSDLFGQLLQSALQSQQKGNSSGQS